MTKIRFAWPEFLLPVNVRTLVSVKRGPATYQRSREWYVELVYVEWNGSNFVVMVDGTSAPLRSMKRPERGLGFAVNETAEGSLDSKQDETSERKSRLGKRIWRPPNTGNLLHLC